MSEKKAGFSTTCVHAGVAPDATHQAIMTPIFQTSTYVQDAPGQAKTYDYARAGNPTRTALEQSLAALEGARHGISYASGLAAVQAVVQILEPGSHVLVCDDVYGGSGRLFRRLFAKYGIEFDFVDMTQPESVIAGYLKANTRLLWVESPTNPLLKIIDIAQLARLTRPRGIPLVVDNTFASPAFQSPLALGADIVMHSVTKYIGGHSDVVGGCLMLNDDALHEQLRFVQFAGGAVNAPMDCFFLLRSIKTLALRMERHQHNALALARALESMEAFEQVIYPGLESHPQHALAAQQMSGFSGMISVRIKGGFEVASRFMQSLELFALAESLGGVESLVNHPETMTHASVPPALREQLGISGDLIRFSVGIEDVEDLIADVEQALARTLD
ncbi:trans-sulfuration enzyme family protein [Aestuariirhabdus litorea]|uniref:Aminotransferase class I/II-fold pyridoxal phosphate-dependent enzyme n=1 Tax=Aestuariirhabdus litorea TaxID=2528527 RepID=A0A3P3VKW5_9GAMM|nr:aminotransferase class I/II-fold pyridoxal phosphate-dependent enzyme [Aestuariirhabdus litorea]RRJ83382.1 aminotransferase class I/II-fold pyridoxal phosphate-dependent enzyme [Aestuariirhabdus litorea]RWW93541.1 aminotransferase class I/II-fold pyridoxal phosphate-dependent enzyme [Endozoicomonadaceae bacterium GTF-13]